MLYQLVHYKNLRGEARSGGFQSKQEDLALLAVHMDCQNSFMQLAWVQEADVGLQVERTNNLRRDKLGLLNKREFQAIP